MLKVALVIASQGFQAVEYHNTKKEIEDAGYQVVTVSDTPGIATAHDGTTVQVQKTLDTVRVAELAGLFLIGGPGAMDHLDIPKTHALLQEANDAHLPLGAICISVRILARAYVLTNRNATGWDGDDLLEEVFSIYAPHGFATSEAGKEIQAHGAHRVHKDVVVDHNIITAAGPHAATEFGKAIVRLIHTRQ